MAQRNILYILFIPLFLISIITSVYSLKLELFYGEGCPHCEREIEFLNSIKDEYSLKIDLKEIYNNQANKKEYDLKVSQYNPKTKGVPTLIIGDKMIVGFSDRISEQILEEIKNANVKDNVEMCTLCEKEDSSILNKRISVLLITVCALLITIIILLNSKNTNNKRKKYKQN